jgi:hypothetical protein
MADRSFRHRRCAHCTGQALSPDRRRATHVLWQAFCAPGCLILQDLRYVPELSNQAFQRVSVRNMILLQPRFGANLPHNLDEDLGYVVERLLQLRLKPLNKLLTMKAHYKVKTLNRIFIYPKKKRLIPVPIDFIPGRVKPQHGSHL